MVAEHEGKNQRIWQLTGWCGSRRVLVFAGSSQQQPAGFCPDGGAPQARIEDSGTQIRCERNLGLFTKPRAARKVKGRPCSTSGWHDTYQDVSPTQA